MENSISWLHDLLNMENAKGIIALSAIIAWLLPKILYFGLKLFFSTLLFLANVFGRDKIELWLKNRINTFLSGIVQGARVTDIPRWLNKDQVALREFHWEREGFTIDVPSVIITINLPTFGYGVFKLKLRYLFNNTKFMQELRELLHESIREIRVQEPSITYISSNFSISGNDWSEEEQAAPAEDKLALLI